MARRRFFKPTPTLTIHVSEEFYRFVNSYSSSRMGEPKYRTIDRLMYNYINKNPELYSREVQELRDTISLLRVENRDLKDTIHTARQKIRDYELRLGIITREEAQLQVKNELVLKP